MSLLLNCRLKSKYNARRNGLRTVEAQGSQLACARCISIKSSMDVKGYGSRFWIAPQEIAPLGVSPIAAAAIAGAGRHNP